MQENYDDLRKRIDELLSQKQSSPVKESALDDKFDSIEGYLQKSNSLEVEIRKQLSNNLSGQNLVFCDSLTARDSLISMVKIALGLGRKPVIVLTSISNKYAKKVFSEAKMDSSKMVFIDMVSKSISNSKEDDNVFLVDSPSNLTQLEIKSINALNANKGAFFVFDLIDVLLLYHEEKVVYKFLNSFVKILRNKKIDCLYLLTNKKLFMQTASFFDNTVELKK